MEYEERFAWFVFPALFLLLLEVLLLGTRLRKNTMNRVLLSALLMLLTACDQMRIGNPAAFWFLWTVPLLLAFFVYSFRRKTFLLRQFAKTEILHRITVGISRSRQYFKAFLILLGLTFALLALTEIKYGFTWEEVRRKGVDIVITLDVSDSMLVEDVGTGGKLTRLTRAKREITDLLRMLDGDRVGLVAFAGTAFTECPLTLDYSAAEVFLDAIDTDLIPLKGTAIGSALKESLKAFEGSAP